MQPKPLRPWLTTIANATTVFSCHTAHGIRVCTHDEVYLVDKYVSSDEYLLIDFVFV